MTSENPLKCNSKDNYGHYKKCNTYPPAAGFFLLIMFFKK